MKSSSLAPVSGKGCSTSRVDAIHPIVELNLAWGLKKTIKLKSSPNSPKLIPLDKPLKMTKDDIPAIDEGFDYVNFPSQTPDE